MYEKNIDPHREECQKNNRLNDDMLKLKLISYLESE